ncbi:MAG: amidohydrolase [Pseudonocardia sp.]|uniref:amidohydrolase family protein n=1 Tax=unclassified Pseudonocardia TaxID=2619320 RepID=UPI00086A1076|nr:MULTISPECIES: amidohydrolase family protein [unclassified Pseudonocardia]MBN9109382.1 amidohydrolase [Pseudonocardia sp.]ODU29969.1 MAG: amidohydrolase [Pseudonocardia sp. SCN 72-51]ODV08094.1 MAG: amidohydrolase [Pseudonocardia sp. SCN 73-27]
MTSPFPRLISADDHVLEPATLWTDRLPSRYRGIGPHVRREKVAFDPKVSLSLHAEASADGVWADVWHFESKREPLMLVGAAVGYGHDEVELRPTTFDEVRPGCYIPAARLADMDMAGVEASLCFPNMAPTRFCGQGFLEAQDRELGLLCVRAYNDYMIDEWCADSGGRLVPLCIIPLWDPELAAQEVRRTASRGNRAVCFSEAPARLGLPSIHSGAWEPFFQACEETGTVLMIHVGSSSHVPMPSDDAPMGESNILVTLNSVTAMVDWLFSGIFVRYPNLKICLAECQIGWVPYILQRADEIWEIHGNWAGTRARVPELPSTYFRSNVFVTFFSDVVGLRNLDAIGADNVLVETDYPHSDSTWPCSQPHLQKQVELAGITDPEIIEKIARGNARKLFQLD